MCFVLDQFHAETLGSDTQVSVVVVIVILVVIVVVVVVVVVVGVSLSMDCCALYSTNSMPRHLALTLGYLL